MIRRIPSTVSKSYSFSDAVKMNVSDRRFGGGVVSYDEEHNQGEKIWCQQSKGNYKLQILKRH